LRNNRFVAVIQSRCAAKQHDFAAFTMKTNWFMGFFCYMTCFLAVVLVNERKPAKLFYIIYRHTPTHVLLLNPR